MRSINEEHYTPDDIIHLIHQVKDEYVDFEITEYLEPSAGDARLIENVDKPFLAYDINPKSDKVIRKSFLDVDIEHKKGRVCLMSPPFSLCKEFLNKSLQVSDYVITLLPRRGLSKIIDYNTTQVDYVSLFRDYDFGTTVTSFFLVACRKKNKSDEKYEVSDELETWRKWLKENVKVSDISNVPPFSTNFVEILK